MGPTASGKTDTALRLAASYPVDIVSVDSALVYRGLDIGTAKPDKATLEKYPHALVDILDPNETYSVAKFLEDVQAAIAAARERGRVPLLVGGTMMYFNALRAGLNELPETSPEVRQSFSKLHESLGTAAMHRMLVDVDAETASRLSPNDPQRVLRALEVYAMTGVPLSHYHQEANALPPGLGPLVEVGLMPEDRQVLHERIEKRFDAMLAGGFIEEVEETLMKYALRPTHPSMRLVGYRQALPFLEGQCQYEAFREKAITATRQLAKRQMTWLRSFAKAPHPMTGSSFELCDSTAAVYQTLSKYL